jgi:hypothetical protein
MTTLILTNWRRRDNLEKIVQSSHHQIGDKKIVIVDNASDDPQNRFQFDSGEVEIIPRRNELKCWERWLVSKNYNSEFICIMDDDLNFTHDGVLEDCRKYMEENPHVDAIGAEGVKLQKGLSYWGVEHKISKTNHHQDVHIIKGRFFFVRSKSLIGFDETPDPTCDDIKISRHLNKKIVAPILSKSFIDLPQGTESLSGKKYQQIQRDYAAKKYFKI